MDAIKEKITKLSEERETLINEINKIKNYYDQVNSRVIEINGALKALSEMCNPEEEAGNNDSNS